MGILVEGRLFYLLITIIFIAIIIYYIRRGTSGKIARLQRIPALDAVDEAVKRAVEMDRPVFVTPGKQAFTGKGAMISTSGLEVCFYVAHMTARTGARVFFNCGDAVVYNIAVEKFKQAYIEEGFEQQFEDYVTMTFHPSHAWSLATYQLIGQENVGSFIWVGNFGNETVYIAEQAVNTGSFQVGGATDPSSLSFMVPSCDFVLMGEEIYAAGAYLSEDPVSTNVIASQDLMKIIAVLLTGVLVIAQNLGFSIESLFGM